MCVPGCQEAVRAALSRRGFFREPPPRALPRPPSRRPKRRRRSPRPSPRRRRFKAVVDLTHTMSPDFPTFFGVPGIEMQKQFDFKKDGFNLNWWRIIEHAGTHLDAPIHFSENGDTAEKIPAEHAGGAARGDRCAPPGRGKNPDYLLSREDLADWEKKNRRLPDLLRRDAVRLGAACRRRGQVHRQGCRRHIPFSGLLGRGGRVADEGAQGARHRGRYAVARQRTVEGFQDVHRVWLPSGRWGLENVANLDKVPATGATLVVGAAKVKDATGGPVRLIALV